jgi:hypothetical protein
MINVSSAMGIQFAQSVGEINTEIKKLGPNPLGLSEDLKDSKSEIQD